MQENKHFPVRTFNLLKTVILQNKFDEYTLSVKKKSV